MKCTPCPQRFFSILGLLLSANSLSRETVCRSLHPSPALFWLQNRVLSAQAPHYVFSPFFLLINRGSLQTEHRSDDFHISDAERLVNELGLRLFDKDSFSIIRRRRFPLRTAREMEDEPTDSLPPGHVSLLIERVQGFPLTRGTLLFHPRGLGPLLLYPLYRGVPLPRRIYIFLFERDESLRFSPSVE